MVCFVVMDCSSIMRAHEEVSNQIITCVFINMMYRSGLDLGPGIRLGSRDQTWVKGSGLGQRIRLGFGSRD